LFTNLHILLHIDGPASPPAVTAQKAAVPLQKVLMRDVASLLLVAYVLLILNPVMPVIVDAAAHTFWEKQHLLTIHNVNGKYHVHFELLKNDRQTDNKVPGNLKTGIEDYIHAIFNISYSFVNKSYSIKQSYPPFNCLAHSRLLMDIDYPPPRA
jgi:hypothetical protein